MTILVASCLFHTYQPMEHISTFLSEFGLSTIEADVYRTGL